MNNFSKRNAFIRLWLIIGLVMGFAAAVFFSITYLNEKVLCDLDCKEQNEVSLILILLSLFGVFIGSITYYFISEKYEKKINKIHKNAGLTLNFLDDDDKKIISSIVKNNGKLSQSKLVKETNLSRVKISRSLKRLENKKIISKQPDGMTNQILLDAELSKLFVE